MTAVLPSVSLADKYTAITGKAICTGSRSGTTVMIALHSTDLGPGDRCLPTPRT